MPDGPLWGGFIDVNYLMPLDAAGRDEVFRRAGDESLSIRVHISSSESRSFVVSLLFGNWKRIKLLSITIADELISKADWNRLYWPARYLQFFSLADNARAWSPNPVILEGPGQLFSNDASQLQIFQSNILLPFDTSASWLTHLQGLCLHEIHGRTIPFGSLLDALKVMHQLESLYLTSTALQASPTADVVPVSVVEVPSLLHLRLSGIQIMGAINFFDHLPPRRGRGLQAKLKADPPFEDSVEAEHFKNTLARYTQNGSISTRVITQFTLRFRTTFSGLRSTSGRSRAIQ